MGEAICLVLDVGASASQKPERGVSFLDAALECASLLVERKLFEETKDEFGLVFFGTEGTRNPLSYENVEVSKRGFCRADWDTVKYLREHIVGTEVEGDWVDGLVVALDYLRRESEGKKYTTLKIVLFSDLGCPANAEQMDDIINGIKLLDNVDLTHIGPEWKDDDEEDESNETNGNNDEPQPGTSRGESEKPRYTAKPRTKTQETNENVINQIIHQTEGTACSLDDAVASFLFRNKRGKKPFPWKVVLEIGPDIKISTTGYTWVRREAPKSWKRCLARADTGGVGVGGGGVTVGGGGGLGSEVGGLGSEVGGLGGGAGALGGGAGALGSGGGALGGGGGVEVEELKPAVTYVRNNEDQEEIETDDMVVSYRYGDTRVTISDADEAAAKFDGGPKSLMLFGFISRDEIKMSELSGNGSMVFLQTEEDENSEVALSVLTQAMQEMGVVAIVRRVYNRATAPRLGVLTPEMDDDGGLVLSYVDLPFSEDRRELQFAPLIDPRRPASTDQLGAVDDLIDAMDLEVQSADEEGKVAYLVNPEEEMNPLYQFLYQALTEKALNPNSKVPSVPSRLLRNLNPPSVLLEQAAPVLTRIQQVFPLEEVELRVSKRTGEKVFGAREEKEEEPATKMMKMDEEEEEVKATYVGSINPVQDFNYLLSHSVTTGASIEVTGLQLEQVIERLLASAFGTDLNSKIVNCLKAYREACKDRKKAEQYNNYIRSLVVKVGERLRQDILEAELGLLRAGEVFGGEAEDVADAFLQDMVGGENKKGLEEEEEEDVMDLI